MDDELTIQSALHSKRVWRRVGERDHVTRDGRSVVLVVWQSTCVICGDHFEAVLPRSIVLSAQSHTFETTTCPEHRMTSSESAKLRFAKAENRRVVFEAIKADKLADRTEVKATEKRRA